LFGGYLIARRTWARVGQAWNDATGVAREKGVAA
jgi:branched-chain amino acid transport system permease protein